MVVKELLDYLVLKQKNIKKNFEKQTYNAILTLLQRAQQKRLEIVYSEVNKRRNILTNANKNFINLV